MPDLLNAIEARSVAMGMLTMGVAPYTSTGTPDPSREFWEHAQGDIAWLIDDLKAARKVIEGCRALVHAESLDSSHAAVTWGDLVKLLGEYDWRHEEAQ